MTYYFTRTLKAGFDETVARTRAALGKQGFGVLTEIDVSKTLKEKIGAELRPYLILGACNPHLAYEALAIDDKIGTMLPCNVVVQKVDDKRTEVAVIDPVASMAAIGDPKLTDRAKIVAEKLRTMMADL